MQAKHYPTTGDPVVFIDFETTGLCARNDRIIEIAAVKYIPGADFHPHMQHLIKIDRAVPKFISRLTGITDEMLNAAGRPIEAVLPEFINFIGDSTVVAFNMNFDARFLNAAVQRQGLLPLNNPADCALERARLAWPHLQSHKLRTVAEHLRLDVKGAHRALNDALLALEVYFHSFCEDSCRPTESAVKSPSSITSPNTIPIISGPQQFRIEVLGTKKYQEIFENLCGPREERGAALNIQAQLRLEKNSNVVRVLLQQEIVGNLSPRLAHDFRKAVIAGNLAEFTHFECAAKVRGGKASTSNPEGQYAMWLDIPQDDD